PEVLENSLQRLRGDIEEYLDLDVYQERREAAILGKRLEDLTRQRSNITSAIASYGPSEGLHSQLTEIESQVEEVRRKLSQKAQPSRKSISFDELSEFVMKRTSDLKQVLRGDPVIAREALGQVISDLILTPVDTVN